MLLYITFNCDKINDMKNFAFKILIFIVLITIISLIFFKKDYGFDTIIENNFEKIKDVSTLNNNPPASKNVTINDVDYLQSQLPIGKFGGSFRLLWGK